MCHDLHHFMCIILGMRPISLNQILLLKDLEILSILTLFLSLNLSLILSPFFFILFLSFWCFLFSLFFCDPFTSKILIIVKIFISCYQSHLFKTLPVPTIPAKIKHQNISGIFFSGSSFNSLIFLWSP